MSTKSRVRHALWLALASITLLMGLPSAPVRAQEGNLVRIEFPPATYASLPADERLNDPHATGSLPSARKPVTGRSAIGFSPEVANGAITIRPMAPTSCLPGDLRSVVADVAAKFGPVSIESTHRSEGHNRRVGGARHSMHIACRAVDFRLHARSRGVMAYLGARDDVGGLKMYRNGIIHIDNGSRRTW